jgi:outer membrane lipoprotein-sorting protein
MFDKSGNPKATYHSKTKQHRQNGCRTTEVVEEKTTGDFYTGKGSYNYNTAELYAALFFAKGQVCGEDNIVKGHEFSTQGKSGIEKHKEQLKMLFFNPGKKIPGIPFIGDKLDLYDDRAHKYYDYRLDYTEYQGKYAYVFSIKPKEDLSASKENGIVVDAMTTWFDASTMEVMARNYALSYKAGVYDFNVSMEVQMTKIGDLLVPQVLRYKGNWSVILKKRENGQFTATLFDFKK